MTGAGMQGSRPQQADTLFKGSAGPCYHRDLWGGMRCFVTCFEGRRGAPNTLSPRVPLWLLGCTSPPSTPEYAGERKRKQSLAGAILSVIS